MIRNLIKKLLEFWDIYGGVITSIIIAFVVGFEKKIMDKVTSFTSMTLVITSVYVSIKIYYRRERKTFIDAFVLSESPIKAINPIGKSKDITHNFKKIKENKNKMDLKKKLYTLFNNKWTIISLIWDTVIVIALTALSLNGKFNDILPDVPERIKVWLSIGASILFLIPSVYTTVTKYGFETYSEIINRKKNKMLAKADKKTKEVIEKVDEVIEEAKEEEKEEEQNPLQVVENILNNTQQEANERLASEKVKLEEIEKLLVECDIMKNLIGYLPDAYKEKYTNAISEKVKITASIMNDEKLLKDTADKIEKLHALNI